MLEGLNDTCTVCNRRRGDHTLDEFAECLGSPTLAVPYGAVPEDTKAFLQDQFAERLPDYIIADHLVIKAAGVVLDIGNGVKGTAPMLILDFAIGTPGRPPTDVAKVAYLGTRKSLFDLVELVTSSAKSAIQNSTI